MKSKSILKINQAIKLSIFDGVKQIIPNSYLQKHFSLKHHMDISDLKNDRLCIFFNSLKPANEFVENHLKMFVYIIEILIWKLIKPSKRIILSNASPIIPDETIFNAWHKIAIILFPVFLTWQNSIRLKSESFCSPLSMSLN